VIDCSSRASVHRTCNSETQYAPQSISAADVQLGDTICRTRTAWVGFDKHVLQANYGKDDEDAVAAVKALYEQLGLEAAFREYEAESYERLKAMIHDQTLVPPEVFTHLLDKIYKRQK